jgi:hypothetical protein
MGTVYSINSDGTVKNERERYFIKRRGFANLEPAPTGPINYSDVIKTITDLKTSNEPPFLFITYEESWGKNPHVTKDNDLTRLWNDKGTAGWDWSVYRSKDSIFNKVTEKSDYVCVGDVMAWTQGKARDKAAAYFDYIMRQKWLYVHKSICYYCPARQAIKFSRSYQILYEADVASGPADVNYLYYPLGLLGSTKYGKSLGVLRAFLVAGPWNGMKIDIHENCCGGPYYFLNQASKGNHFFVNAIKIKQGGATLDTNYTLCSPDEALYNLISSAIGKTAEKNAIFQGLVVPETRMRHEPNARALMFSFCNTDLEIPEFPDICACIGRKGVEDALRVELSNDMVRMVCQSTKCLSGDRTGNIYTFTPSPPCAPINICKPGLDINAAKVTMSNVTFNCNFAADSTSTQILSPPVPPATPAVNTTPAANTTVNTTPPTDTTPAGSSPLAAEDASTPPTAEEPTDDAKPPMDQKTIIAIGAGVAIAVLIIIIVIVVVVVKRKKKN